MKHHFLIFLFTVLLSLCNAAAPPFDERFQFLYFAALEGAHADGLTDAEVDRILLREDGKGDSCTSSTRARFVCR